MPDKLKMISITGRILILMLFVTGITGCSKPEQEQKQATGETPAPAVATPAAQEGGAPDTTGLPKTGPMPEPSPATVPPRPATMEISIMKNPDFTQWENEMPVHWNKSPWAKVKVTQTDQTQEGKPVIEVAVENSDTGLISQDLISTKDLTPGDALSASAWVKADEPKKVYISLVVTYVHEDDVEQRSYITAMHPGDGKWHKLEVSWNFPRKPGPRFRKIGFQARADNPTKPFLVAGASATQRHTGKY